MGHGWAMDGPQVGLGQALGDTIFGQSLVFMSNICLAYVQPKNTVIYKYFEEILYLDKDWTNRGHAGVLRLSKFSLAAG